MIKKRFLSMLALLCLTVTSAWAQEVTLLTTIESTGDNASFKSGSKTFDNIATVTFSGTVYNDGDHWGWYSREECTLTVTAAEGYTITRVKFYTNFGSAFDEEAPFEAILQCDDEGGYVTKVNGTLIGGIGVTKIEVYGYAGTPEPATVAVTGVTLAPTTATLTAGGAALELTPTVAPEGATDKTVKWSVEQTGDYVALYTDEACTQAVGTDAIAAAKVYVKPLAAGQATITVTTTDGAKTATCAVTVAAPAASTYDFEDGNMPAGWDASQANNTWYVATEDYYGYAPAYSGTYSLYVDGNGAYDSDYFISPALVFDGSAASLSFAYATPDWEGDHNDLSVCYGTSPNGPWNYTSFKWVNSSSWTTATVDLSSLNGTYYIAFESYDGYGYCTAIDNINITGAVPAAPTTYTVTLKEGTEDATNWTITPAEATTTGVAAGTEVKATYGGTKKVKSVKAVKKAKPAATVTTAPTAKTGVKAGEDVAIVNEGTAEGGTMMYMVNATQPASTDGFSATVPTAEGLTAGTYYVWYYVKADDSHTDSEISASGIEVTIAAAETIVTWTTAEMNESFYAEYDWANNNSHYGITVTASGSGPGCGGWSQNSIGVNDSMTFTFTSTVGNIKSIVITARNINIDEGSVPSGWTTNNLWDNPRTLSWNGTASTTVNLPLSQGQDFSDISTIVFTLE